MIRTRALTVFRAYRTNRLASDVGTSLRDRWGVEHYYNVAINSWLHLTSDLQFAGNEFKGDDVAVIPGIRLVMDF